jgi:hypothetical protein
MTDKIDQLEMTKMARSILLRVWDPVGIKEFLGEHYEAVKDEYDAYLPHVLDLVKNNSPQSEIENYLFDVEVHRMHRRRTKDKAAEAADLLYKLRY